MITHIKMLSMLMYIHVYRVPVTQEINTVAVVVYTLLIKNYKAKNK